MSNGFNWHMEFAQKSILLSSIVAHLTQMCSLGGWADASFLIDLMDLYLSVLCIYLFSLATIC